VQPRAARSLPAAQATRQWWRRGPAPRRKFAPVPTECGERELVEVWSRSLRRWSPGEVRGLSVRYRTAREWRRQPVRGARVRVPRALAPGAPVQVAKGGAWVDGAVLRLDALHAWVQYGARGQRFCLHSAQLRRPGGAEEGARVGVASRGVVCEGTVLRLLPRHLVVAYTRGTQHLQKKLAYGSDKYTLRGARPVPLSADALGDAESSASGEVPALDAAFEAVWPDSPNAAAPDSPSNAAV